MLRTTNRPAQAGFRVGRALNTPPAPFVPRHGATAPVTWVRDHLSAGFRRVFDARCKAAGAPSERTVVERRGHFFIQLKWGGRGDLLPLHGQRPLGFSGGRR